MSGAVMAKERDDVSIKINKDVYRRLRTVAAWKGVTVGDYLSQGISPVIERDTVEMMREMRAGAAEEVQAEEAPKRRKPKDNN